MRVLCFLALLLTPLALHAAPELLRPGDFHGEEVSAASGEPWWALVERGGSFALEERTLRVELVHDPVVDEADRKTGKRVSAAGEGEPLFLLRGVPGLRAGPVDAKRPEPAQLYPGASCPIGDAAGSELLATGRAALEAERLLLLDYALWLRRDGRLQKLAALELGDESPRALIFAGDLDRDGKADLVADLASHYNLTHWVLFLSSAAKAGELVREVASHDHGGC